MIEVSSNCRERFWERKAFWPKIQAGTIDRGLGGPLILRPYLEIAVAIGEFFSL
jgi:hypothetical protein